MHSYLTKETERENKMWLAGLSFIKGFFTTSSGSINWGRIVLILGIVALGAGSVIVKMEMDKAENAIATAAKDKVIIKNAVQANSDLVKQIKTDNITKNNEITAITTTVAKKETNKQIVKTIIKATNQAVSTLPVTPEVPPTKKQDAASIIRINAVWKTYCSLNPSSCN